MLRQVLQLIGVVSALLVGGNSQAAEDISCHDTDTFTPLKFSIEDDDDGGPVFKFEGFYSGGVVSGLGLLSEGQIGWKAQNLVITLPNQPKKSIHADHIVRHYTSFDLEGLTKVTYKYDGKLVSKDVYFRGFESVKMITSSRGISYLIVLNIQHPSGKYGSFKKNYYSYSCR